MCCTECPNLYKSNHKEVEQNFDNNIAQKIVKQFFEQCQIILFFYILIFDDKRGTAIDLKTREFQQYTYIDQPDEPEEEVAPVVVTCPASPSDSEMILAKALFTFLLSTTVVTFALLFVLFLFGIYYLYLVIIRKKKISCNWLQKKRTNRKISTMSALSTTSTIIKSNKNMGFCEHCKGPCCTNPMKRQSTLRRGQATMRSGGTISSAKNSDYFNLSSLSRIGSMEKFVLYA